MRIFNMFWWKRIWYEYISCQINPRNKWLTKVIPKTWCDKDALLEIVIIESLKHLCDVNGEDYFNVIESKGDSGSFDSELRKYHVMATIKLPSLQQELNVLFDNLPGKNWENFEEQMAAVDKNRPFYEKIDKIKSEIESIQTEIMVWVVKNRRFMWT